MRGDYGDQMHIVLDPCEYHCPYCNADGTRGSLIAEQMGVRNIDIPVAQTTTHKVMCLACGNIYTASKYAGAITYGDGAEFETLMKGGYKSLRQQYREAEEAKKAEDEKRKRLAAEFAALSAAKAEAQARAQALAEAEAEFNRKVESIVEKILAKKKRGLLW